MHESPRASLLGFAIAASVAVVPVLLAVLVGLGRIAPSAGLDDAANHVSVRHVAALKTFEHAIVRRDSVSSGPPTPASLSMALPECADAWSGRERAFDRVREWLRGPIDIASTPAHRVAAQLAIVDEALRAMSTAGNRRVVHPVGLDGVRWAEAARRVLQTPVEAARYPDRRFFVRCSDLASAVAAMSRARGRMLATLAWRGTEVERTIAGWRPDQYVSVSAQHLARANPWDGIPGCIYLHASNAAASTTPAHYVAGSRAASGDICNRPPLYAAAAEEAGPPPTAIAGEPGAETAADDPRWQVPPSIHVLLQPLGPLQRTSGALYRAYTGAASDSGEGATRVRQHPNRVSLDGADVDVGFSVDLTIDPALQAVAQKTAACYTGRQDVCRALGITRTEDGEQAIGHRLLERAMVRMAAIAIVDVRSGRIEALAGALSPCTRQEYDGPGRAAQCDQRLPYPIRYRPDALRNAAVYADAMPASVVKPVMAAAFLSNARVGSRWLHGERSAMRASTPPASQTLRGQLMRSDSARFLDRMFCADDAFRPCERPWEIQSIASAFGWNDDCETPSERCGQRDFLFGRSPRQVEQGAEREIPGAWISYGRLLAEPSGARFPNAFRARSALPLDLVRVKRCALGADGRSGTGDDWEKCRGGTVVDVVAEGWGQGHARASALGAAGMLAALAGAANGQADVQPPHLVRDIRGTSGFVSTLAADVRRWRTAAIHPGTLSRESAEVILDALSYGHRFGTARRACEQVFDARACREIDWIAGKTGTPTFPNDERSLDDLAKLCVPGNHRTPAERVACGGLRPYKWYVAAYRTDTSNRDWTKAIAVLAERNWLADSGRIHGAGDHGPNPAAEIAFQVIGRHAGTLVRDPR